MHIIFLGFLQRAKKIFLLYNASSEDFISSEPSRFLMQLEYFKQPNHELKQKKIQLPYTELRTKNKLVEKTEKILIDLKKNWKGWVFAFLIMSIYKGSIFIL